MNRLLSIQGGGIRGIVPACALVALEQQTGKLTRDLFDWVGGTSTGALLSATIAAGVPAKESLKVYLDHGREIFTPVSDFERRLNLIARGRQFDARVLYRVVKDTLGAASTWRINDSPVNLMITAADQLGDCVYFVKDAATNAGRTGKFSLVNAAVASACATTYHDPWMVPGLGYCADGGTVGVADPVYQVCVEAFYYGDANPKDTLAISLGTGRYKPATMPHPPENLLERISWVTSALVGASKTIAAQTVDRHWPGLLQVFNVELASDVDEADVGQIPQLLELGQAAAAKMDWRTILNLPA